MFGIVRTGASHQFFEVLARSLNIGPLAAEKSVVWPGQVIGEILVQQPAGCRLVAATWTLLPPVLGDSSTAVAPGAGMIMYPDSVFWSPCLQRQRCMVIADALISRQGGSCYRIEAPTVFALAGLYRCWEHDGHTAYSCALISQRSDVRLMPYVGRHMPLLLPTHGTLLQRWLDPAAGDLDYFRCALQTCGAIRGVRIQPIAEEAGERWLPTGRGIVLSH